MQSKKKKRGKSSECGCCITPPIGAVREMNGSVTLHGLTDGCGAPRSLNVHGYRVAMDGSPRLAVAVLTEKNKVLGTVILHPEHVICLMDQVSRMM